MIDESIVISVFLAGTIDLILIIPQRKMRWTIHQGAKTLHWYWTLGNVIGNWFITFIKSRAPTTQLKHVLRTYVTIFYTRFAYSKTLFFQLRIISIFAILMARPSLQPFKQIKCEVDGCFYFHKKNRRLWITNKGYGCKWTRDYPTLEYPSWSWSYGSWI